MMTPAAANSAALHHLNHITNGWDGYSLDDAAEAALNAMEAFLTGELTVEADITPHCDEYCG